MPDSSDIHPSPDQLAAFGAGRLGTEDAALVAAHVAVCASCRAIVEVPPTAEPNMRTPSLPRGTAGRDLTPPVPAALAGHPRYRVTAVLGVGGMGAVYKAEHRLMERTVALKVIKKGLTGEPAAVERFRREVKAAARLSHPNIVTAHDAEQAGDVHFLVMEFVEGTNLARLVKEKGPLPVHEACDYARQAALGLEHAHQKGMVHRDVKPHNLMLTPQGQVKILDFGLASLASAVGGSLTDLGVLMGTPDYMAPEQTRDAHRVDSRADIYSLGCTLFHLIAGRPPFKGGTHVDRILAHRERTPPPLSEFRSDLPVGLAAVVERMLAKDPARRFQTPGEVAEALAPFAVGPDGAARSGHGPARRRWAAVAVLLGVLTLAAVGFGFWRSGAPRPEGKAGEGTAAEPAGPPYHFRRAKYEATVEADGCLTSLRVGGVEFLDAHVGISRGIYFVGPGSRILSLSTLERAADTLVARGDGISARYEFGQEILTCTFTNHTGDRVLGHAVFSRQVAAVRHDGRGRWAKTPTEKLWEETTWFAGPACLRIAGSTRIWGPWEENSQVWEVALEAGRTRQVTLSAGTTSEEESARVAAVRARVEAPESAGPVLPNLGLVSNLAPPAGTRSWTLETRQPRGVVEGICFSPDGARLATAGSDGAIRVWEVDSGRLLRVLTGHQGNVRSLAWSPDGKALASACWDGTARVWDPGAGRLLHALRRHTQGVNAVTWSPQGNLLASACSDGAIRLWDPSSGALLETFQAHPSWAWCLAWSPDGTTLASGGGEGVVTLWDAKTRQKRSSWKVTSDPPPQGNDAVIYYLCWAPDSKRLATASGGQIRLWEAPAGRLLHKVEGGAMAWGPDGKTVASAWFNTVGLWEADSGRLLRRLAGHGDGIFGVAFSPDGKTLASGSRDGGVRLWQADPAGPRGVLAEGAGVPDRADWSPDGKTLACGLVLPARVHFWEPASASRDRRLDENVWARWSPDGKTVAARSPDLRVRLLRASNWQEEGMLRGSAAGVADLAWAPDGKTLATADWDRKVRLWDAPAGSLRKTLEGQAGTFPVVAWSADGRFLASGGEDCPIRFWEGATGEPLRVLEGPDFATRGSFLSFSPDSKTLAVGNGSVASVWDTASGQFVDALLRLSGRVSVAWSPDGATLFTNGGDGLLRCWDAREGTLRRVVPGPAGPSVFSPDRRRLASAQLDAFRLWDADTGRLLATLVPLPGKQVAVVSPDGHFAGAAGVEQQFVHVVETEEGQELLSPEAFATKYAWKNVPDKARVAESVRKP